MVVLISSGPEAIHPAILTAIQDVRSGIMNGKLTDQKSIAAATMYCQIRAIEYTKVFAMVGAGFLGVIALVTFAWVQIGRGVALLTLVILSTIWGILSVRLIKKFDQRLSWREIGSLKAALALSPAQAVYLDCLQALDESSSIPTSEKLDWATRLNSTLEAGDSRGNESVQILNQILDAFVKHGEINSELDRIKRELDDLV